MAGRGEDRAVFVLQHVQPVGDVRRKVVLADCSAKSRSDAEKRCTQFGDEFLDRIAF